MSATTGGGLSEPVKEPQQPFQSLKSRSYIVLSFYLVVLISLPIWYKTTTIVRLPLPIEATSTVEAQLPCPIRIPHFLNLRLPTNVFPKQFPFHSAGQPGREEVEEIVESWDFWERALSSSIERHLLVAGDGSATQGPLPFSACADWNVRVSTGRRSENKGKVYDISYKDDIVEGSESGVQGNLVLDLPSEISSSSATPSVALLSASIASQLAHLFQLPYHPLSPPSLTDSMEQDRRSIPFTRNVRLVLSLMNEDASFRPPNPSIEAEPKDKGPAGVRGWDRSELEQAISRKLGGLLEELRDIHRFGIESQTQWVAPLAFPPRKIEIAEAEEEQDSMIERGTREFSQQGYAEEMEVEDGLVNEDQTGAEKEFPSSTSPNVLEPPSDSVSKASMAPKPKTTSFLIDPEDLKIFVNSGEWSLSTTSSSDTSFPPNPFVKEDETKRNSTLNIDEDERTLHFILYVASPQHRPLKIAQNTFSNDVSPARGWLIPQWGGVVLYDLDSSHTKGEKALADPLRANQLDEPFSLFEKQLRTLVGLREGGAGAGGPVEEKFALDALTRRRLLESARDSAQTLGSIVRLVDKIENLGVGHDVQGDINLALKYLRQANETILEASLADGDERDVVGKALEFAHLSSLYASRAFFNPNMIGQLYFPDEHKYAVYTPLFGPLAVPLLVSAVRLYKERRERKKEAEICSKQTGKKAE